MSIIQYVRNIILIRNIQQKLLVLCCLSIVGIVMITKHRGKNIQLNLNRSKDSYIQYNVKELRFGKLRSAVNIGNRKQQSSTTPPTESAYSALTIQDTKEQKSMKLRNVNNGYFTNIKNKVNYNVNGSLLNTNKKKVSFIDNTASYRRASNISGKHFISKTENVSSITYQDYMKNISGIWNKKHSLNQTLILLVTYLRSGSTFTADLIQQTSNVFYLYEPLKPYIRGQHYFTLDSVCHTINGTCRKQTGRRENISNILNDLSKFYRCDLLHVPTFYFRYSNKSRTMLEYDYCRHHKTQLHCLLEFQEKCFKSVKMIKTIRMNMDVVEKLIEQFPKLKVIHLIRDPRGTYQSRKNGYFIHNQKNLEAISKSNCDTINSDLQISFRLKKKYPEQIKTLLYERIAEEPIKASRILFRFLGLTEPVQFESWINKHTKAGYSNGYYDTVRKNSVTTAYLWRKYINLKVVKSYDKNCKTLYSLLGFKPLNTYKILQNISYPAKRLSPVFGDFLD